MRKRLTAKRFVADSRADGLFPGDVGNEERSKNYHDIGEYDNYDWQEGWDLPSGGKVEDKRDEMNLGIKKEAHRRALLFAKAKKASILSQLFLGDSATDSAIQAQARDFMKLSYSSICDSIARFKASEDAQEQAVEQPVEAEKQVCKASDEIPAEAAPEPAETAPAPVEAKSVCSADDAGAATEEAPAGDVAELEAGKCACGTIPAAEEPPVVTDAPAEEVEYLDPNAELIQSEADPELERMFAGDDDAPQKAEPTPAVEAKTAKRGIKHLAAQPKLASADTAGIQELEEVWKGIKLPHI